MYCGQCGSYNDDTARFCTGCGVPLGMTVTASAVDEQRREDGGLPVYELNRTDSRSYEIRVYPDRVDFDGEFTYLVNKDFVRPKVTHESGAVRDFLGISRLSLRPFKRVMRFVIAASVLEVVKAVIDKLSDWVDKANMVLFFVGKSIELPAWMESTMNLIAAACLIYAVWLFFSKRNVIEISFTDKRICVPQRSMSEDEYMGLYRAINSCAGKQQI